MVSTKVTEVAWDPFARAGILRRAVGPGTCSWCGRKKRVVFQYVSELDFIRVRRNLGVPEVLRWPAETYCNLRCARDARAV